VLVAGLVAVMMNVVSFVIALEFVCTCDGFMRLFARGKPNPKSFRVMPVIVRNEMEAGLESFHRAAQAQRFFEIRELDALVAPVCLRKCQVK
jgi:hypothetical protein